MARVVHFEVHAADPDRAINFYQSLLGWEFTKWDAWEYWMIRTGPDDLPGINGGLVRRQGDIDGQAVIAYVCSINVDSLDPLVEKALELGGQVALPKMAIPGVGWLAYVKDTEGNIFGLMQDDPSAA